MQIVRSSGPASPSFGIRSVRLVLGIIACVGIALTLFSLLFGFRSIPTNSVGVKLRFGALSGIEDPGLTYVIPYMDELVIVPTQRLLKLEFGFGTSGSTNLYQQDRYAEDTETMITGDLNTALVPCGAISNYRSENVFVWCARAGANLARLIGKRDA